MILNAFFGIKGKKSNHFQITVFSPFLAFQLTVFGGRNNYFIPFRGQSNGMALPCICQPFCKATSDLFISSMFLPTCLKDSNMINLIFSLLGSIKKHGPHGCGLTFPLVAAFRIFWKTLHVNVCDDWGNSKQDTCGSF